MPVSAVLYTSPDLIPANMRRFAAVLYPTGETAPSYLRQFPARVFQPTDALPAGERTVGVVKYAPGDAIPANLRRIVVVPPGSTSYQTAVLADSPVGFWRLSELGPATLAADTFGRVDSASSLGTASDGVHAWSALNGTWGISSGAGYLASATTNAVAVVDPGSVDQSVQVDVTLSATANRANVGVVISGIDTSNYLTVILVKTGTGASDNIALWKRVGGTSTSLASVTSLGLVNGTTYTVRVVRSGSTVTAYLNGVAKISYTLTAGEQTTFATATKAGIRVFADGTNDDGGSRFDNFSVTALPASAADLGSGANAGTYTGGVSLGTIGRLGGLSVPLFDGLGGYVDLGSPAALAITGDLTLEAWVYKTTSAAFGMIVAYEQTSGANIPYQFRLNNGSNPPTMNLNIGDGVGAEGVTSTGTVSDNGWHHVAVTKASNAVKFYVDGAAAGTATLTKTPTTTSAAMTIGKRNGDSVGFFPGYLADVAVYATALSAARIAAHYAAAGR